MSDAPIELIAGLLMGAAFIWLGAVLGFAKPTEEEAAADPASLRWGRRPTVRRWLGIVIILAGVVICALRLWMMMR